MFEQGKGILVQITSGPSGVFGLSKFELSRFYCILVSVKKGSVGLPDFYLMPKFFLLQCVFSLAGIQGVPKVRSSDFMHYNF